MNLTSQSMQDVIMRNMGDVNVDPHLKKLLEELNSLKQEIYGTTKRENKNEQSNNGQDKIFGLLKSQPKKRRKPKGDDETFRAVVAVFGERRKSDRLSGTTPKYDLMQDIDELENEKLFSNGQLKYSRALDRRPFFKRQNVSDRVILNPEEITTEMLNNICYKLNDRIYDKVNGSSCHQCRQKTIDTKTICRNLDCFGVRGQFCGPCAKNRYGVDVKDALLDPYWSCFVCQGICNCSFCRSRKGKRPTGILAPIANREGHISVKEFLDALKKKIPEEDDYNEYMQDPESTMGFVGLDKVCTLGGTEELYKGAEAELAALFLWEIIDSLETNTCFSGFTLDSISETRIHKLNLIIESLSKN